MHSPTITSTGGIKRAYQADEPLPQIPPLTSLAASSAFRNVSACNRCRLRKNRCDQHLPACSACEKARVKCVGYDPITKQEIPRSYVYYLESRVSYLESLLSSNNITFKAPEAFDPISKIADHGSLQSPNRTRPFADNQGIKKETAANNQVAEKDQQQDDAEKLNKLVSNIGMVSVQGASDPRYLGSTSGISFARVVFAAVKSSVSTSNSERGGVRPSKQIPSNAAAAGGSSMRDSFFGLQTKPLIKQAAFPERKLGEKLVNLYFEHANPQIPILHRGEFKELFDRAYASHASEDRARTPARVIHAQHRVRHRRWNHFWLFRS